MSKSRWLAAFAVTAFALAALAVLVSPSELAVSAARPAPGGNDSIAGREPRVEPPLAVDVQREVAEPLSESPAPRVDSAALRAHVVLRGQLRDAQGLGHELELRVRAFSPVEPMSRRDDRPRALGQLATAVSAGTFASELASVWQLPEDDATDRDEPCSLSIRAEPDGALDADITELYEDRNCAPLLLSLEVRHRNFESRGYLIAARGIDPARLARDETIEIQVDVTLVPRCVVRGSAWARDGGRRPIEIEAWLVHGGRPAGLHARDSVSSADDVYELQLLPDQRYAIVAFADGLLPVTTVVYTFGQLDQWLAPFVLDAGAAISGRVELSQHLFGGETALYLASRAYDQRQVFGPSGLIWNGSAFTPEAPAAVADSEGRFTLAGLAPGSYDLRVGLERGWWTEMDPLFGVHAPSSEVLIEPPLVNVTIALEYRDQPLADHAFQIRGFGRGAPTRRLQTDAYGRASFWLCPSEPYSIEVPMERTDWTYGKVVPWNRSAVTEHIRMATQT